MSKFKKLHKELYATKAKTEAVNFSVSMGKNPSSKIQICTTGCRIMGLILVSIYLSDYSITNFHGSIQECQTFLHQK